MSDRAPNGRPNAEREDAVRYYIVRLGDGMLPPFVAAECVDLRWARDELYLHAEAAVLSEEELLLDPDLSAALEAWNARDDRSYAAWESAEAAEIVLEDVGKAEAVETIAPEDADAILAEEPGQTRSRSRSPPRGAHRSRGRIAPWGGPGRAPAGSTRGERSSIGWRVILHGKLCAIERRDGAAHASQVARVLSRRLVV